MSPRRQDPHPAALLTPADMLVLAALAEEPLTKATMAERGIARPGFRLQRLWAAGLILPQGQAYAVTQAGHAALDRAGLERAGELQPERAPGEDDDVQGSGL